MCENDEMRSLKINHLGGLARKPVKPERFPMVFICFHVKVEGTCYPACFKMGVVPNGKAAC